MVRSLTVSINYYCQYATCSEGISNVFIFLQMTERINVNKTHLHSIAKLLSILHNHKNEIGNNIWWGEKKKKNYNVVKVGGH